VSGRSPYSGKPRPAVIVREDRSEGTSSTTLCVFTTDPTDAPLLRHLVEAAGRKGLSCPSRLMIDKITIIPKARRRKRIGKPTAGDLVGVSRALTVFLELARQPRSRRAVELPCSATANAVQATAGTDLAIETSFARWSRNKRPKGFQGQAVEPGAACISWCLGGGQQSNTLEISPGLPHLTPPRNSSSPDNRPERVCVPVHS
jgi:mRNA interferase MazF